MTDTTHPGLIKAMSIYDEPGDMAPHQQEFLKAVHVASQTCLRTRERAIQDYGYGSERSESVAAHAYSKERAELAAALEKYEQELEEI